MIRFFDIFFSGISIIILFPFVLPIIILLKFTGEHYIFYKQSRIGKNKKPFFVFKFATMLLESPNMNGGLITVPHDPRLLPMGNFLRRSKINELPQLINIFIGNMSFVGYRPFVKVHYDLYTNEVKDIISSIKPGLTGIGSVIFHNEEEILHKVSDREYFHDKIITPYKGQLECWYVKNRTIKNYFLLILCTAITLIRPNNHFIFKIFKDLPSLPISLDSYL